MLRFFLTFIVLQLTLFGINMLGVVQQHVVLPWTALLARGCAALVTLFDASAAAALPEFCAQTACGSSCGRCGAAPSEPDIVRATIGLCSCILAGLGTAASI